MSDCVQAAADIATVVSAAAAVGALAFVGVQIRDSRRATTLQVLQTFLESIRDHEGELSRASSTSVVDVFADYLNLLEVYAAAINKKLAFGISREIISQKIEDAIAVIENTPEVHPLFESAISTDQTFEHIAKFRKKHGVAINRKLAAIKASKKAP